MTISYSDSLLKILGHWRGSVWRSVYKQLLVWLLIYYIIRIILDCAVPKHQEKKVADLVATFNKVGDNLPLSFILGFYVSQMVTRWWTQVMTVPVPDNIVAVTNSCFPQKHAKPIRQSVARWLVLAQAMVFRRISSRVRKRFPKLENLIDAGLLSKQEMEIIRGTKCLNNRWQLPLDWVINKVITPSEIPPVIQAPYVGAVNAYRDALRTLFMYDWVCLPLVYTQTCSIVVYGYFLFCLIGRQYNGTDVDLYVPWVTILQFIFYIGWLNVAGDLMRPFGEDDDDIELNCILDRNAAVGMNMAEQVCEESPDIIYDERQQAAFNERMLSQLTYSTASLKNVNRPPKMHAVVDFKNEQEKLQVDEKPEVGRRRWVDCLPFLKSTSKHPPNCF